MIKEFAFGLAQRHYFQESSEICNWMNIDRDTYMSLYDFDSNKSHNYRVPKKR